MIKSIKLVNFRLFDTKVIDTPNSLVIFSGKNATGKTSVLEAIYLCSTTKSHRTSDIKNLIKEKEEYSLVEITSDKKYKVTITDNKKAYFINKKEIKKAHEFIGNLNTVLFSPLDLFLVNGSNQEKRRFLDLETSLINKSIISKLSSYKKLLVERNNILKQSQIDDTYLEIITKQLCDVIKPIYDSRIDFINKLNSILIEISKKMNIETIKIEYKKTYEDDIYKSFMSKINVDKALKTTNIGLHRDYFKIYINDKNAANYASEGQIRTICIAIKLAIYELRKKENNIESIILLDDVFAALDKSRIRSLIEYIKDSKQVFITTTSILEVPDELLKNALVIRI